MINRLELPVNKKHFMRSSTTRAGLYSIMTSDEYAGSLNAIISDLSVVIDDDTFDYFLQSNFFTSKLKDCCLSYEKINSKVSILSSPYVEDKYAYIYKKIECEYNLNSILIKIDYMQDSNAWSSIKIVFSNGFGNFDNEYHEMLFDNEYCLKLSVRGLLVFRSKSFYKKIRIFESGEKIPVFLKLEHNKEKECIEAKYSLNGENFNIVGEAKVGELNFREVGVYLAPKVNPFFYDFYASHIQLCIDSTLKRLTPFPDMEDQYFSNMLDVYQMPREIFNFDNSIINTFIMLISMGYYIRLRLDEFYIQGGFHFDHANFIYGYDIDRKKFQMIGYHKFLEFFELDFEKFILAAIGKRSITDKITLYKYNSKYYPDKFNIDMLLFNLKAYIAGKSEFALNSRKAVIYDKKIPMVCGIKVYDEIIKTEEYMKSFVEDIRMSHQLQEHNFIMIDLIKFLKSIGLLSEEFYTQNIQNFQENLRLSEVMKHIVMKHEVKPIESVQSKLQGLLKELKEKDEKAMKLLVSNLENKDV